MTFDREKYLQRIKYSGGLEPNLDLLKKLQKTHLLHVPFENLDIHYTSPIELDIERIYDKIVLNNRGGFCYELNGLFYELLLSLGYKAKRISARVFEKTGNFGPEYDHFTIIVQIGNVEYLTDVGFGEFIFEPLQLQVHQIQEDVRGSFLIDQYNEEYLRVSKFENGEWIPAFIFKNEGRAFTEFKTMCKYHQSNPNSHFVKKRLISIPNENGRVTISGNILKVKEGFRVMEEVLENENEFEKALWEKFRIRLKNNDELGKAGRRL